MSKRLSASFVNLVHEAALKSFWRRKTLWRFLRQQGVSERFLASWDESESKRDFLDRLTEDFDHAVDLLLFRHVAGGEVVHLAAYAGEHATPQGRRQ